MFVTDKRHYIQGLRYSVICSVAALPMGYSATHKHQCEYKLQLRINDNNRPPACNSVTMGIVKPRIAGLAYGVT